VQSWGYGRELFGAFRAAVSSAEEGASVCFQASSTPRQPELREVADHNIQNQAIDA
jgi:phosphogluconate dehydratase